MYTSRCFNGAITSALLIALSANVLNAADDIQLSLRFQNETSEGSGRYHRQVRPETWKSEETAVIVCDMWDLHHCLNAVRRGVELAPRLDRLLTVVRQDGVTIIHAPSSCMGFYSTHPARRRALDTPVSNALPDDIQSWCSQIPSEEKGTYPLDQSDGGEDDDPDEHARWVQELQTQGRDPGSPWKQQTDLIKIDPQRDYISDQGDEVWSILEHKGIKNVILAGVHTNMCVLGRPFGLRQMARNGKNVVLMRDLTDTMYNPESWPYVSHFTGTDLIVSHIERFICPTVTSDQILGGAPFRFEGDERPHVAIVMAEGEYGTEQSLPEFAAKQLGKLFRVSLIFASDTQRNEIPGLETLNDADVALISVRRRTLRPESLAVIKRFVESGKPVIGIRTASHAFSLRNKPAPDGYADWPELDAQVWGGSYSNHYGNQLESIVTTVADASNHPILSGVSREPFKQGGSLYMTSPLADRAVPLLVGRVEGHASEPVAWTFQRADGGRSFYTSLGHRDDFENPTVVRLLVNAVCWAANVTPPVHLSDDEEE